MKRKILTGLQLALLLATFAIAGTALTPTKAEADSNCPIRCFEGGPYQCGFENYCWWTCT